MLQVSRFWHHSGLNSNPVSNSLWNVLLFIFPKCAVTWIHARRSLWGKTGRIITTSTCHAVAGSFLRGPRLSWSHYVPYLKTGSGGFPGGAVVENPPANAGDTGSSPGLGRSHMPRSNWAREPQLLSLRVWSLCSATREAAMVRGPHTAMRSGPRSPQLEKVLAQKRRPNTAKNK